MTIPNIPLFPNSASGQLTMLNLDIMSQILISLKENSCYSEEHINLSTLASACRVSKSWSSVGSSLLYSNVKLNTATAAIAFYETLSTRTDLCNVIQILALEAISYDCRLETRFWNDMLSALPRLIQLRSICLAPIPSRFAGKVLTALESCGPRLKKGMTHLPKR